MGRGCEASALRTTGSTDEGLDPKGALMGLGANYWMSSCCYAYTISEALRLPGFGPLQGLDAARMGPCRRLGLITGYQVAVMRKPSVRHCGCAALAFAGT